MSDLQTIVYVEDDPDIREIAALALEDVGGLTVKTCSSGEEALKAIPEMAPQILLLDVMMPGMDGPELLSELRERGSIDSSTMVLFMTAKVHPEELERYESMGVKHVISKPFDPMTLAEKVRSLWNEFNDR